jgi:large subunit ribosomal protein L23
MPKTLKEMTGRTPRDIIIRPIVTEKSVTNAQLNKYTFEVRSDANKIEIRDAIHVIFKVNVVDVTTMNMKGKPRTRSDKRGRHQGHTKDWKKAIVTLKEGEKIEIAGSNPFEA